KYAIGEIVLVMIGILLALQVNNWNENRKGKIIERESYQNLLTSLKKDSLELLPILSFQNESIADQNRFIESDLFEIKATMSNEEISRSLYNVYNGAYSFFPKYGTYNAILSNEGIDLLRSKKIKSLLIELYDYQFKKYEDRDAVIDHKFMFDFIPFLQRYLGFFVDSNSEYNKVDMVLFEENYEEFVLQCQNINTMTKQSIKSLIGIQKSENELISLIRKELEK
ncbi:MAG: hypothetical protein KAJ28_08025, partial [Flavobacteriaceae bacterium]|nr:hypothetical protein [Flavobacteriaceae bacterium]